MPKRRIKIEVLEDATGRFLMTTYADGEVVRLPIVQEEPKRRPLRPYRKLSLSKGAQAAERGATDARS